MNDRKQWIDFLKGIAIVSVIYYHTGVDNFFIKIITSFHMWLFFWLSGYCFNIQKYKCGKSRYIRAKAYSLLLPYVVFVSGYTVLNFLLFDLSGSECLKNILVSNQSFGAIWFLMALFVCVIISNEIITRFSLINSIIIAVALFIVGYSICDEMPINVFRIDLPYSN